MQRAINSVKTIFIIVFNTHTQNSNKNNNKFRMLNIFVALNGMKKRIKTNEEKKNVSCHGWTEDAKKRNNKKVKHKFITHQTTPNAP